MIVDRENQGADAGPKDVTEAGIATRAGAVTGDGAVNREEDGTTAGAVIDEVNVNVAVGRLRHVHVLCRWMFVFSLTANTSVRLFGKSGDRPRHFRSSKSLRS